MRERLNSSNSSFGAGKTLPDSKCTFAAELAHSKFSVEKRNADEKEHEEVGNKKHSSSIFISQVRKSPDISKTDAIADAGKNELDVTSPGFALAGISNLVELNVSYCDKNTNVRSNRLDANLTTSYKAFNIINDF
jgi:hypothetical protein